MVPRITRLVPRFKSLSDFLLAKKWYMRALQPGGTSEALPPVFMPGPERHDLDARMRRHGIDVESQPDFSLLQIRHKDSHKLHMSPTLEAHKP